MKQEKTILWFSVLSSIVGLFVLSVVINIQGTQKRGEPDIRSIVTEYYLDNLITSAVLYDNMAINAGPLMRYNMGNPFLVIRYSGLGCKLCVDYIAREVSLFFPDLSENDSVVFVASDLFDDSTKYGKTIELTESESLGLAFEETLVPFVFIVDSERIQHFYIPDKEQPDVLESYLQSVKERYDI